ncbi:hypothetical protein GCK32_021201, partial [Trichostrongylus colubriformis]
GTGLIVGHPLDTVKARLQTMSGSYKGIIDCTIKTAKQETVCPYRYHTASFSLKTSAVQTILRVDFALLAQIYGLYKGMFVPFLMTGTLHSLLFTGYGTALRFLHPSESNVEARKDLPMSEIMIASTCGAMAQLIPVIPVELLKTRLQ